MKQYFKDIYESIVTVFKGMVITFRHLFTKSCTLQYPDEKWTLPELSRMRLFNKIEDCIGCGQCVRACPVDCIYMTTEKRTKEEAPACVNSVFIAFTISGLLSFGCEPW